VAPGGSHENGRQTEAVHVAPLYQIPADPEP
jgi:hypothetical protein